MSDQLALEFSILIGKKQGRKGEVNGKVMRKTMNLRRRRSKESERWNQSRRL